MKISPRIVKIRRKKFTSIVLSICHYQRSPITGKPMHKTIKTFKTIRSDQISDPEVRKEFYSALDQELLRLLLSGYMRNDIDKIRQNFETAIPKPTFSAKPQMAKPSEKSDLTELQKKYPVLVRD